jgi:hypothetical protein
MNPFSVFVVVDSAPNAVIVPIDFGKYKRVSRTVRERSRPQPAAVPLEVSPLFADEEELKSRVDTRTRIDGPLYLGADFK